MEKYQLLGLLGRGYYDNVYKGRDLRDNSTVAMKLIKYDSKEQGVPCLAIREISVLKELKHDNVVGALDVFDTESGFYLVSELMRCDLSTFIRVDIWSVGCAFAEMVRKKVLFGGRKRKAVMSQILGMFRLPDEKDWPGVTTACLNLFETEKSPSLTPGLNLAASVPRLDTQGLDLLSKLLCLNPNGRITAHDALKHPYFNDLHENP